MKNLRILVDTDPGLGLKYRDVDDGLALFLMLNNNKFEIEGITTVFGNTPVEKGYILVRKYLEIVDRTDIPHKKGASCKDDLGHLNEASQFLINKVKENPKELTLLALGPLTNIATALIRYPDFLNNLKEFVFMGGAVSPLTTFYPPVKRIDRRFYNKIKIFLLVSGFNFWKDGRAAKKIIEAATATPRIQMPWEICTQVVITKKIIKRIGSVNKPIPQFISKHIKFWSNLNRLYFAGGIFPFDVFVPIYLIEPELFESVNLYLSVDDIKIPGKISILKKKRAHSAPISFTNRFRDSRAKEEFIEILISNLIR
jgi:purine nucleosidase